MTHSMYRRVRALLFVSVSALPCASWAQSAPPATDDAVEALVVTGARLANQRAIAAKRSDGRISDGVSADEVGSLPDFGFGEALQRVPGVALLMNNQRGEAQFATVRGLNSSYTLVTRDGVALPATEQTRRNVSLDVLPSSIATRVIVAKSLTPDMDANAIGGQIDFRTPSAFDARARAVSLRGDIGRYQNEPRARSNSPSGRLDGLFTGRFGPDERYGGVLAVSYFRRVSSSLDGSVSNYGYYGADGKTVPAASPQAASAIASPLRRQWYNYDNVRERVGVFGKLERRVGGLNAHLSGAVFEHENDEFRNDNLLISSGALKNVTPTSGTASSGTAQIDFDHFDQKRRIAFVDAGLDQRLGPRDRLTFSANYAVGTYKQTTLQDVYKTPSASSNFAYDYVVSPGGFPVFTPVNANIVYDPAQYRQSQYGTALDKNVERVTTLNLDYAHNMEAGDRGLGIKAGGKLRALRRKFDHAETYYEPIAAASAPTLASALGAQSFAPFNDRAARFLFVDPEAASANFQARSLAYRLQSDNLSQNIISDYRVAEKIYAGYLMTVYRSARWSATGGLRYERTELNVDAPTQSTNGSTTTYAWRESDSHYGKLLPSITLNYELTDRLRLRAAYSQALGRPDYKDVGSARVVSQKGLLLSITEGNPALKPRQSRNYDLSLEWYGDRETMVSAAVFHKAIRNEIFNATSEQTATIGGVELDATVTRPENLDRSAVTGLELNVVRSRFGFRSGPLAGLGASANLTLLRSDDTRVRMNDGSYRQLRGLIEAASVTGNVSLLYENGPFKGQLAYNRTGRMLWTVATDAAPNDRSIAASDVVDLQVSYRVRPSLTLVAQAKNLTNDRPGRLQGPDQELLKDVLDNGRSYFLGFAYRY
jgi:TonB-dependent receptor